MKKLLLIMSVFLSAVVLTASAAAPDGAVMRKGRVGTVPATRPSDTRSCVNKYVHPRTSSPLTMSHVANKLAAPMSQRAPMFAGANLNANLNGVLIYDSQISATTYTNYNGIYHVDVNAQAPFEPILLSSKMTYGAFVIGEKLYAPLTSSFSGVVTGAEMNVFNLTTGTVSETIQMDTRYDVLSATYVPSISKAFCFAIDMHYQSLALITLDLNGTMTLVRDLSEGEDYYGGLTLVGNEVYGLAGTGKLYRISTSNGAKTLVGDTGISNEYISALAYDAKNGVIYSINIVENTNSSFFTIDPATGVATRRYDFDHPVEFGALYAAEPIGEKAPAAATDLKADFPAGALTGTFSFTAPSTTFDEQAASGKVTYSVMVSGQEIATGESTFGAGTISVPVTIAAAGLQTFEVTFSNAAGKGATARLRQYIGKDTCAPLTGLQLSYSDGAFRLSWDEPKGVNGGYVDTSKVTYKIERYVGNTSRVVATAATGTSFTDPYTIPENTALWVYYTVTPTYDGATSSYTRSDVIVVGDVALPFTPNLNDYNDANLVTFIDANGDGATWRYTTLNKVGYFGYPFHPSNAADDYLVLPAIRLQKGKLYFFEFEAGCRGNYPERIAAYVGKAPTAEALTTQLLAPTVVTTPFAVANDGTYTSQAFSTTFIPEEDGTYYFAIKACSDANQFWLCVPHIYVSAPTGYTAPAAPTALTLVPDAGGAESVTVSFTAPITDIAGNALTSLDMVEIYRDGELVNTCNPAIGAKETFVDVNVGGGNHDYEIVGYNEAGRGLSVKGTVYAGITVPAAVTDASIAPGADYGLVDVAWEPVTKDANGKDITDVTYVVAVYDNGWVPVATDLTGTSAEVRICEADAAQSFAQIAVFAQNVCGIGSGLNAGSLPVGAPYTMPYQESFKFATILGATVSSEECRWDVVTDSDLEGLTSQDHDDAFIIFSGSQRGDTGRLYTGRIHIDRNAVNPTAVFHYFNLVKTDLNTVQLLVNTGAGFKAVGEPFVMGDGVEGSWNRAAVALDRYKGLDVQLAWDLVCVNIESILIDNLLLESMPEHEATLELSVPSVVEASKPMTATVMAENLGKQTIESFSVDFIVNHEVIASREGKNLRSGASMPFTFTYDVPSICDEVLRVDARINVSADTDWTNNFVTSEVFVELPDYPSVTDLTADVADGNVNLSWTAPDAGNYSTPVTDDLESYDSWANMQFGNKGDWTFLDLDGQVIGGFEQFELPGAHSGDRASFFVFDDRDPVITSSGYPASFACHSGHQCFAAMYNSNGRPNDDWAISPELSGEAQFISFYARAYSNQYPETIEVLYSTTDRKPESFISADTFTGITTDNKMTWTRYQFRVPQGAKYFAIRFCSYDTFMVMIDDITYTGTETTPLNLLGYNVYCDGVKLNESPVKATSYAHVPAVEKPGYRVTAVYEPGESKASKAVYPFGSGVDEIFGNISVKGLSGEIEITGATAPVKIVDMQGRTIYTGTDSRIPAPAGAYIVRTAGATCKVIVK